MDLVVSERKIVINGKKAYLRNCKYRERDEEEMKRLESSSSLTSQTMPRSSDFAHDLKRRHVQRLSKKLAW